MDASNLPLSFNIEDRRPEADAITYPSRYQVIMSLLKGVLGAPPPPLRKVETWNGDPNQQYTPETGSFMPSMEDLFRRTQGR